MYEPTTLVCTCSLDLVCVISGTKTYVDHCTLIKVILIEYQDNVDSSNDRCLIASLLKRFWWDKMTFDCKAHCQHCVVCN
jgi:hypothetical protein